MASVTGISLNGVRVFAGPETYNFDLAPLTVFTGTNSSGKSTVLKMLGLLRQSQGINEGVEGRSARLRFKGGVVDLGNFKAIASNGRSTGNLSIGLRVQGLITVAWSRWINDCEAAAGPVPYKIQSGDDTLIPLGIETQFTFESAANGNVALLRQAIMRIEHGGASLVVTYSALKPIGPHVDKTNETLGENLFEIIVPSPMIYANGVRQPDSARTEDGRHYRCACMIKGLLPAVLFSNSDGLGQAGAPWLNQPLPSFLQVCVDNVKDALRGVHYVGPLRASPKRYYQVDWDQSVGLDPVGDFVPFVLRSDAQPRVLNRGPGNDQGSREPLSQALNKWLRFFRTGNASEYASAREEYELPETDAFVGLNLVSAITGHKHPLVDSGFGMSQVIPLIVRCLIADDGEIVLIEQPEVHLHPALQVRLGDFFWAMVLAGKRIVVETHSEHLVNSVRALIAENAGSDMAARSRIYFLAAGPKGIVVHNMSLRKDGTMSEWPPEFFGEAIQLSARVLKAQRAARTSA